MNEQWQELKETITELRDNDGTGTQQEVCKFLANLMDVLEKGASLINEDAISRQVVMEHYSTGEVDIQNKKLAKIRAEIDRQEKWLMDAGYTAYNVDIAFNAIKSAVTEGSENSEND